MKRIIALLSVIMMLMCVASCSDSASVADKNDVDALTTESTASTTTEERTIRIMPLGDSLTAGYPDTCAYRNYLCDTLLDEGYNFMFVGPYTTPADRLERYNFPEEYSNHAAVGGRTIQGIMAAKDDIFTEENTPDIIMLMITTNDMAGTINEQLEERYRELVAYIFRTYPDVTLYCANPIPKTTSDGAVVELNSRVTEWEIPFLKQLAADKQENGYDMRYVDMTNNVLNFVYEDIREDDHIHPTDSGNQKLANAWYNAIKPRLDELSGN